MEQSMQLIIVSKDFKLFVRLKHHQQFFMFDFLKISLSLLIQPEFLMKHFDGQNYS